MKRIEKIVTQIDIPFPETCGKCPLDSKGCSNIVDFINDTLDTDCEEGVIVINHKEV